MTECSIAQASQIRPAFAFVHQKKITYIDEVFLSVFRSVPSICRFTPQGPGASFQYCAIIYCSLAQIKQSLSDMDQSQSLIYFLYMLIDTHIFL